MAADAVRIIDLGPLAAGSSQQVGGARKVAEETRHFIDWIVTSIPITVAGGAGAVIAPGGHPLAVIQFEIHDGAIRSVTIHRYRGGEHLAPTRAP